MSSLSVDIRRLKEDLTATPTRISAYYDLPFAILRYDAEEEWDLRWEARRLAVRLGTSGKQVHTISLAALLWEAIENCEGLDAVIDLERERGFEVAHIGNRGTDEYPDGFARGPGPAAHVPADGDEVTDADPDTQRPRRAGALGGRGRGDGVEGEAQLGCSSSDGLDPFGYVPVPRRHTCRARPPVLPGYLFQPERVPGIAPRPSGELPSVHGGDLLLLC